MVVQTSADQIAWCWYLDRLLQNVYNRWKIVLDLIIEDYGEDRLIEAKRGKLYRAPSRQKIKMEFPKSELEKESRQIIVLFNERGR